MHETAAGEAQEVISAQEQETAAGDAQGTSSVVIPEVPEVSGTVAPGTLDSTCSPSDRSAAELVQPDADANAALEGLRSQAANMVARLANGPVDAGTQDEVRVLLAKLTANGTALLLGADCDQDYETCTAYFKLALQVDAGNLHVAKLVDLRVPRRQRPRKPQQGHRKAQLGAGCPEKSTPEDRPPHSCYVSILPFSPLPFFSFLPFFLVFSFSPCMRIAELN